MKKLLMLVGCSIFISSQLKAQSSTCQPPVYYFNSLTGPNGNAAVNTTYKFSNVLTGVDAKVTITKIQNASISKTDMDQASPYSDAWQPFITFPARRQNSSDSSYIEFKIEFQTQAQTPVAINQSCLALTIIDLDGSGASSYREMLKVSNPGTPMGILNSTISVTDDSRWMVFRSGTATFNNIDTVNKAAMSQINFPSTVNSLYMRVGVLGPVSAGTTRQFSFYFKSFTGLIVPLPVHVFNFNANTFGEHAQINWSADNQIDFSHFELYRSFDGRSFDYVESIYSKNESSLVQNYSYNDRISEFNAGNIFYKLKLVDNDGQYSWTTLRSVSLGDNPLSGAINHLYPNPADGILNVDLGYVPFDGFKIEVTDMTGKVLSTSTDPELNGTNATLNVSDLERGIYTVRVVNADGSVYSAKFSKL